MTPLRNRKTLLTVTGLAMAAVATACTPATGNAGDYSISVNSGWVQRWNPCAPVHYQVNVAQAPTALATVFSAVAQLSKATGITFVYGGGTGFIPNPGSFGSQPAPLVISFAHHAGLAGGSSYLSGVNQIGEGGYQSAYYTSGGRITSYQIVKGYAVIDSSGYARASAKVKTAVLLHELGHAVGLNHARYATEVMYPVVSDGGAGTYSAGDLAGLAKVGRGAGCIS